MNLANKVTLFRVICIPVFIVLTYLDSLAATWAALVVYVLASISDFVDGYIARKYNMVSNFGKFMDPVADKFMVIGTFLVMLFRMMNPGIYGVKYQTVFVIIYFVAVLLVIFRELAITSLRLVLVNTSGQVVAAKMLGKIKTVCQIVCTCFLFIEPLLDALICHLDPTFFFAHVYPLSYLFVGLMLFFTLWSGIDYMRGGWKHISTDW